MRPIPGEKLYPAGSLTTALGGSRLLATFVQQEPFYTAQNVAVLQPKDSTMSPEVRLYYALAIASNRFRYTAFGREANRTLRSIPLPRRVPDWVVTSVKAGDRPSVDLRSFGKLSLPSRRGPSRVISVRRPI